MTVFDPFQTTRGGFLLAEADVRDDRPALVAEGLTLGWDELSRRVEERADQWRHARRLVLLTGRNSVDFVVNYLAALAAGCPVLLSPPCAGDDMVEAWAPDIVVNSDTDRVDVLRETSRHDLHPDLALLLSTSGSTGSPKLVRLSRENLRANAASIAEYLALGPADCGMTSLPLHYCYGLSVLHSHLLAGARVAVSDASVVEERFWDLAEGAGVTGLAGVPHTFDLLEHGNFEERDLPRLRYLTQAGGRLAPDRVRAWSQLGERRGWDFFVMYGQTEATARMAWLPPSLAAEHPSAIGRAVPGGSLRLLALDEPEDGSAGSTWTEEVGELVYSGPNVMMGYAEQHSDLALPAMEPVLRTGDLAREIGDGIFEVVGRLKRITKVFGLRINLDDVEGRLAGLGVPARVVATDSELTVFVTRRQDRERAGHLAASSCGLPAWVVRVRALRRIPMTATGKPDYSALSSMAAERRPTLGSRAGAGDGSGPEQLRELYARVLNRPDATLDDSFVGLGADSLSYVEMSVRLGERIDPLPADWHTRSVRSLASEHAAAHGVRPRRWGRGLDTDVLVRALAIIFIVGSHSEAWVLVGGAHLLLALAGYNFARFHLVTGSQPLWHRIGWALTAIVVPGSLWLAVVGLATGEYTWRTVVYLNWTRGTTWWDDQWRFWFLEALVWALVVLAAVLSIRRVRAIEGRHPFAVACAVLLATLSLRWGLVGVTAVGEQKYALFTVLWTFALGWVMARSTSTGQRLVASLLIVLSVIGFFADVQREALIIVGLLLVLWLPQLRVPRIVASGIGVVSAASLAIYVTQWQVYPHLERDHPYLAVLASVLVGIAYHRLTRPLMNRLRALYSAWSPATRGGGRPGRPGQRSNPERSARR